MIIWIYYLTALVVLGFALYFVWSFRNSASIFRNNFRYLLHLKSENKRLFCPHKKLFNFLKNGMPGNIREILYFSKIAHKTHLFIPVSSIIFGLSYLLCLKFLTPIHFILIGPCFFALFIMMYMNFISNKNKKKFEKQLPDALNLLTNSIKGGSELSEALEIVVSKSPPPIRRSFQSIATKIKLGGKVEDVLKFEKENVTDIDFNVLASAISISVRTGGRLVPILERFQEIMQNRAKLMNKIVLAITIAKTNGRTLMAILGLVTGFNLFIIESNRAFFLETQLGNQLLQLVVFLVVLYEVLLRTAAWWAARK